MPGVTTAGGGRPGKRRCVPVEFWCEVLAQWVGALDCRGIRFDSRPFRSERIDARQVVHTHVPVFTKQYKFGTGQGR